MRRAFALTAGLAIVTASCSGSDDDTAATDAPAVTAGDPNPTEPATPATEAPAAETTPEPETTEPPETTTAPETTAAPETTTTEPPPPPVNAVGLIPLPGGQLDFTGTAVPSPSLVWSVFQGGGGGVIVENVGGPLPPGCHGTSFFDPETFDLLQIDGNDLNAYASRGEGGCAGMQQEVAAGVVDGDAVKVNTDDLILFDFGALPAPPFDVSTQILNPDGQDGVFRGSAFGSFVPINDLTEATHAASVTGIFEVEGGLLDRLDLPETTPGAGCAEFSLCIDGRFQVELVDTEGSPGNVLTAGEHGGLLFFFSPEEVDAVASILNGCDINGHFWVFAAATTNVEFEMTVTDTLSGDSRSFVNPLDNVPEPILDTAAFATCP